MSLDANDRAELMELLDGACGGQLSEPQSARLQELLYDSPEARAMYVDYMVLHAGIAWRFRDADGRKPDPAAAGNRTETDQRAKPASSPLGFLHTALRDGRQVLARHYVAAALVLLAAIVPLAAWLTVSRLRPGDGQPIVASGEQGAKSTITLRAPGSALPAPRPVAVARLSRVVDVRWGNEAAPLTVGEELAAGQKLDIASGLAEITFPKGAALVLQGPAALRVESDLRVFLAQGRLSARLTRPEAHGFTVRTTRSTVVDEGTEFGVDVAPGGDQNVHVFQGKVQFSATSANGKPAVQRQLDANEGTRLRAETGAVDLVAGAGEGFTRSTDKTGHDPHTIAYWRFEDGPVGSLVPDNGLGNKPVRGTADCSGNGNDLFTWTAKTAPRFSADVAQAAVALTGKANRGSLDNSARLVPYAATRDLYTYSRFSHASPIDVQKIAPQQWTIEASVKAASVSHPRQVFVGRDGSEPWVEKPVLGRLLFSLDTVKKAKCFVIVFRDADGRRWQATADRLPVEKGRWYHVAATSDGRVLQLYVDDGNGKGYVLQACTKLATSGNTALGCGSAKSEWSIGRGEKAGKPGFWFEGLIDEVRISDIARQPSEFLFAPPRVGVVPPEAGLK